MWERREESTVAMAATCTVIESACVFVCAIDCCRCIDAPSLCHRELCWLSHEQQIN